MDFEGRILVQLGKLSGNRAESVCTLPGSKIRHGELPEDAWERLLQGRLAAFEEGMRLDHIEKTTERWRSDTVGVKTKYIRVIHHATLLPSSDHPILRTASFLPLPAESMQRSLHPSDVLQQAMMAALSKREVFVLDDRSKITVCAWLMPDELEYFNSGVGKSVLIEQLQGLQVERDTLFQSRLNKERLNEELVSTSI